MACGCGSPFAITSYGISAIDDPDEGDTITVDRGSSVDIDVLANDLAATEWSGSVTADWLDASASSVREIPVLNAPAGFHIYFFNQITNDSGSMDGEIAGSNFEFTLKNFVFDSFTTTGSCVTGKWTGGDVVLFNAGIEVARDENAIIWGTAGRDYADTDCFGIGSWGFSTTFLSLLTVAGDVYHDRSELDESLNLNDVTETVAGATTAFGPPHLTEDPITDQPDHGSVVVNLTDGTIIYTPNPADPAESDWFEYEMTDATGQTDRARVDVGIQGAVNQIPIFRVDGEIDGDGNLFIIVPRDNALRHYVVSVDQLFPGYNPEDSELTDPEKAQAILERNTQKVTLSASSTEVDTWLEKMPDGEHVASLEFNPAHPENGNKAKVWFEVPPTGPDEFTFEIKATDEAGLATTKQVRVIVKSLIANDDFYAVYFPANATDPPIPVNANDVNRDGILINDLVNPESARASLTVVDAELETAAIDPVTPPQHGTVVLNANGTFTYTPNPLDWSNPTINSDSFVYRVSASINGVYVDDTATVELGRGHARVTEPRITPGTVSPGYMLIGGGRDPSDAFNKFAEMGGYDHLVILRTEGDPSELANMLNGNDPTRPDFTNHWREIDSFTVTTVSQASDGALVTALSNATAVFIAGGDQTSYYDLWSGTPIQTILQSKVGMIPIGGTSAGMHILGGVVYTPPRSDEGVTSGEALSNPYHDLMQGVGPGEEFRSAFLSITPFAGKVFDTHFHERFRMGRTVAFAARSPLGANKVIAANESSALIVNQAGIGTVYGIDSASVYFVEYVAQGSDVVLSGSPLSIATAKILRLAKSGTFNVAAGDWWNLVSPTKTVSIVNGAFSVDPY